MVGYSPEDLDMFKSLLGFKWFRDGHVVDLKCCLVEGKSFCFFQFKGKPTERAKTEDSQTMYNGFVILNSSGEVHSAFCPCKGQVMAVAESCGKRVVRFTIHK